MMQLDLFDFELPQSSIALHPAEPRESAKLLRVCEGNFNDLTVADIPSLIGPNDILVVNNTRVLPADLSGFRVRQNPDGGDVARAKLTLNLHKRIEPSTWLAFARPAKKCRIGDRFIIEGEYDLAGTIEHVGEAGEIRIQFDLVGAELDERIKSLGAMPLPPYIKSQREISASDEDNYQTIFAQHDGAVAAPTAGLHFTPDLLQKIQNTGADICEVTLHVGAGTFLPVKVENIADHKMHAEWGSIDQETCAKIHAAKQKGGRIIAVGTTSLRILEAASQETGQVQPFAGDTDIFVTPGYAFKTIDVLMTNFHLPKSTLFMLVSSLCGLKTMQNAYRHAIENDYRFYSYGDATWLEKLDLSNDSISEQKVLNS